MKPSLSNTAVEAAIAALETETTSPAEKIEMLIEMARRWQDRPKTPGQLEDAVYLYCQALELCEGGVFPLLQARVLVGLGTALRSVPADSTDLLVEARLAYQKALPLLQEHADPEEIAGAEMNLGLVSQALAPHGLAKLTDAVQAYQRALRVFTGTLYPTEHAIVQNNIAIAYLSMPLTGQQDEMRQGLAVQAFEDALKHVSLIDHPAEYAMLQNNLGNALQYMPSAHPVNNHRRALAAYDEALRVRTARATPLEYANTLVNKAHVLFNLPDDDAWPEAGNRANLAHAKALYEEAYAVFMQQGQNHQAQVVATALADVEHELQLLR